MMKSVWIVRGVNSGVTWREYFLTEEAANDRVTSYEAAVQREFEVLDERVDLDVTYEQYREIQGPDRCWIEEHEIPHNDVVDELFDAEEEAKAEAPEGPLWVVLYGDGPEEYFGYHLTDEDALEMVWNRNWAHWEGWQCEVVDLGPFQRDDYSYARVEPGILDAAAT